MGRLANSSLILYILEYQGHWKMRLDGGHGYKI